MAGGHAELETKGPAGTGGQVRPVPKRRSPLVFKPWGGGSGRLVGSCGWAVWLFLRAVQVCATGFYAFW